MYTRRTNHIITPVNLYPTHRRTRNKKIPVHTELQYKYCMLPWNQGALGTYTHDACIKS